MPGTAARSSLFHALLAVGLRVPNVQRAADFYQKLGFRFLMAVPDENDEWLLCLLRYGSGSILLGPLDHHQFPRPHRLHQLPGAPRGLGVRIDLIVPDIAATYTAFRTAGCEITSEPAHELWGDSTFSCLDPFGYEWHFTQVAQQRGSMQTAHMAKAVLS